MTELKPAYLIHGDDHAAITERRSGLRALAADEDGGAAGVEVLEGEAGSPAGVARALAAMTLVAGRRVILVDSVERWRTADVQDRLVPAMGEMPPDTTLGLFAREDARAKAPAALHEAVRRAGGQVVAQMTVKRWELPKWVRAQGARLGLSLDEPAAKALVGHVGERQQRLLRELEKLALSVGPADGAATTAVADGAATTPVADGAATTADADGTATTSVADGAATTAVTVSDVERLAASSAELAVFSLADTLVAGQARDAVLSYLRLRQQGERPTGLTYLMAQRLREGLAVALRLAAGAPAAEVKRELRMPARAAQRFVADVARTDPERLRRALCALADLELDSRGGAPIGSRRSALAALSEDTLALAAIEAITD